MDGEVSEVSEEEEEEAGEGADLHGWTGKGVASAGQRTVNSPFRP